MIVCPLSSRETRRSAISGGTPRRTQLNRSEFLLRESNALLISHDDRNRGEFVMYDCSKCDCSCSSAVSVPRLGRKPC